MAHNSTSSSSSPSSSTITSSHDHKSDIRAKVWAELRKVAFPDSRFHYDFASFIPDFHGSKDAADKLMQLQCYATSSVVFITPDNCLEYLREETLKAGKKILMTTYGIRRGFWLLDPDCIDSKMYLYAAALDGMEKMGRHVLLRDLEEMQLRVDLMVTGTGAINMEGIRFGKGHGFFDLEWGVLSTLSLVQQKTTTVAIVHDCQVLDEKLNPETFDTVCDIVVTPTQVINVQGARKPVCGIIWEKLEPGMTADIPPLQELKGRVL
jgi:5-formyltetrahydrofolate cyclo-ligase